ncbi:MAG: DMT family transporter [Phascolarctobacterium sp.]|uniref:DMT family transporter n=1 Tax=Phascolarctobacterium sp. TaxID=2049039 RepID=UPI0025F1EC97|nr:EamA family transporter [Phascolarctobacterium sp.]MCC8158343.1 DMT family transporter [Phascolarctobacterium sp.]
MIQSAYLSIISGACLWGLIALFFKFLSACGFSPLQVVTLRVLVAALLMTAIILKIDPGLLKIRWRDSWLFIGTGLLSLVFFNYCYFRAIDGSSISIAVLLLYTAPVFVMLLSLILFGEKFTGRKMLALLATFCGCGLITGIFASKLALTAEAFAFGLASGFGYALYSIFGKLALRRYSTLTITAYTFYFATLGALPLADPQQLFTLLADWRAAAGALAIALICTVAPYLLYTRGLQDVDAGQASILATLEPLVAAAIGIFVFGEEVTAAKILGMALILASIFILNTSKSAQQ